MKAPASFNRGLLLEALETRTLLAADDPFGLEADFALAVQALSGQGDFVATFSKPFGNQQLVLSGSTDGVLTIDMDKLPSFITNIRISSFAEVNFVGTDQVKMLVIEDVGTVKAADLTVLDRLDATDVASLSVAFAGDLTKLSGTKMVLNARSVDGFSGIFSSLDQLTLITDSEVILFTSASPEQTLYLANIPKLVVTPGLQKSSIHFGLPPVIDDPITDPGTEPPIPGNPPPTPGTDTPVGGTDTPSPNPNDPIVIITLPADERTRAFVAELRELLRSPSADPHQFVLEFLQRLNPAATPAAAAILAEAAAMERGEIQLSTGQSETLVGESIAQSLTDTAISSYNDLSIDRPLILSTQTGGTLSPLPDSVTPVDNLVEIDVLGATPLRPGNDQTSSHLTDRAARQQDDEINLQTSLQAFGSYLVERVSAEFFPGQQSLVLLVDPKPTRAPFVSRNSALDQLASGGVEVVSAQRLLA